MLVIHANSCNSAYRVRIKLIAQSVRGSVRGETVVASAKGDAKFAVENDDADTAALRCLLINAVEIDAKVGTAFHTKASRFCFDADVNGLDGSGCGRSSSGSRRGCCRAILSSGTRRKAKATFVQGIGLA